MVKSVTQTKRKLLDLHYNDQIDAETFDAENCRLPTQIKTPQSEAKEFALEQRIREEAVDKFD